MTATFSDFAAAMAKAGPKAPAPATAPAARIAILGGGPDARMLAALALAEGAEVALFSAYGAEIEALASGVAIRGAGPLGAYQVNRADAPSITATAQIDRAVAGADLLVLTGPIHKQRTYAMVLADHLSDGQTLLVAPGRTFGALEAAWLLKLGGVAADVTLAEAQTLPYWFTVEGATLHLSPAAPAPAATLPKGGVGALSAVLPHAAPVHDVLAASFADGSGLVEAPALLLGGGGLARGGPAIPMGGQPLEENASFRNLIGADQRETIARMAAERRKVAARYGVRDLPDADGWLDIHAGAASGEGRRPVPDLDQSRAILRDAAIGSLAPLVSAAALAGVETPVTEAMLTMISATLKADFAPAGRRLEAMGLAEGGADGARRAVDAMLRRS